MVFQRFDESIDTKIVQKTVFCILKMRSVSTGERRIKTMDWIGEVWHLSVWK